jgi:hypothetical protein
MSEAFICVSSDLETDNAVVSTDVSGNGNVDQVASWNQSHPYVATPAGFTEVNVTLDTNSGDNRDTLIAWGVGMLDQDTLELRNDSLNSVAYYQHDSDDKPRESLALDLDPATYAGSEYLLTYAVGTPRIVRMQHIWFGNRIGLPHGISVGFNDPTSAVDIENYISVSRNGSPTFYTKPGVIRTTLKLEFLTNDFMENTWPTLRDHLKLGKAFYLLPTLKTQNDYTYLGDEASTPILCQIDKPVLPRWVAGNLRSITLPVRCFLR